MGTATTSWTCMALLCGLIFASISQSLPLAAPNRDGLESRSVSIRSPDPRMVPEDTDFLSNLFAKTGMEKLDALNKSWGGGKYEPQTVDDSQSDHKTKASHENIYDQNDDSYQEEHSDFASPVDDPFGFVGSLFEHLKKKFREALNSSDEVSLNP